MRLASTLRWSARGTVIALLATLMFVGPVSADGNRKFHGKTLNEWLDLYMTWALGGDQDDHVGKVRFMPLPTGVPVDDGSTGAADDPVTLVGEIDVTLQKGEAFVLPVAVWFGEIYEDGSIDPVLDDSVFTQSNVYVAIDGKAVLDSSADDLSKNYVEPIAFDPTIYYDEPTSYGSIGAVFFQGLVIVHEPLSVGKHTMTLRSELIVNDPDTGLNFGVIYMNTWNITVVK